MSVVYINSYQFAGGAPPAGGWDLTNASYSNNSFSVSTQETVPRSLFFKNDGTKMYVYGNDGDDVNEYSLSTAWDVTSASYTTASSNLGIAAPRAMFIGDNGSKLYVTSRSNFQQHNLTTAWDVSTAPATPTNTISTPVTTESIWFDSSGTRLYIAGGTYVYWYSLSTAWDITSTLTSMGTINCSSQVSTATNVVLKPDGTLMFVLDQAGAVVQYSLSTAWDITTATHDVSFSVSTQENNAHGLYFRSDTGTQLFVVGTNNDTVYAYNT